eukprot:CAMPEP_0181337390 /NCGR_PEP_ID=MMETSP1101-20121128/27985_1 /TAXON_ID=46948 /ORGANISM="Rhodomonas abbreviata, Strain Caron Lab Isolate" /LENGTH=302 /DNA_ID=CAMNT_0023447865 /DNA_START=21 /DNA_END=929 /DNA_ORIENTATION=-
MAGILKLFKSSEQRTDNNGVGREAMFENALTHLKNANKKLYDKNRLRTDCIAVMQAFPFLIPTTETLGQGTVLKLEGKVYMFYKTAQYVVPVKVLVDSEYPRTWPKCQIRITEDLEIPPHHHRVDVSGDVYLTCLTKESWNHKKSSVLGMMNELCNTFNADPFVRQRQQPVVPMAVPPAHQPSNRPPPFAPVPPEAEAHPSAPVEDAPSAPALAEPKDVSPSMDQLEQTFTCSISSEVMTDPVFTADGHTYEREYIERWLINHNTSPITGAVLPNKNLVPNWQLRSQIGDFNEMRARTAARV